MARKKSAAKTKIVSNVQAELDLFLGTSYSIQQPNIESRDTLSTDIEPIDVILGGGFVIGGITLIVGRPSSGKSALAGNLIGAAQRKYGNDLLSIYLDSEEGTTLTRLYQLGVTNPPIRPFTQIKVEDVFKTIDGICHFKEQKGIVDKPSIIVWDSLANTMTEKHEKALDPKEVIGYKARLLAFSIPKYLPKLAKYNISLIIINQLRDRVDMGMFAKQGELKYLRDGKTIPGGNAIRFAASHLIEVNDAAQLKEEEFGFLGNKVTITTVKNRLFPPNIPIKVAFDFTRGFVNVWSKLMVLKEEKIIIAKGGWSYIPNYYFDKEKLDAQNNKKEKGFRIKEVEDLYNSDDNFKEAFDTAFKDYVNALNKKFNVDIMKELQSQNVELTVEPNGKSDIDDMLDKIDNNQLVGSKPSV